jgi:hypothetical protein
VFCITVGEFNVLIGNATASFPCVLLPLKEIPFPKINILQMILCSIVPGKNLSKIKVAKANVDQLKSEVNGKQP